MKLFLGAWVLVSVAFVLGWGIRSAMVTNRDQDEDRPPRYIRTFGLSGVLTTLAGRFALGGIGLAAFGILAVDGSLPNPVQAAVSEAAERLGLEIPSGDGKDNLRLASPSTSSSPLVHRRVLAVIDNWEGEKDCEYLQALAQAAGATPPQACPHASSEKRHAANEPRNASSDEVAPQPTAEPQPALPPVEPSPDPSPAETPTAEPSPAETPPAETPPADPPPEEHPLVEPPPDDPPPEEPPP